MKLVSGEKISCTDLIKTMCLRYNDTGYDRDLQSKRKFHKPQPKVVSDEM